MHDYVKAAGGAAFVSMLDGMVHDDNGAARMLDALAGRALPRRPALLLERL